MKKYPDNIPLDEDGDPIDGLIKYDCNWVEKPADFDIKELDNYRQKLFDINLIGLYPGPDGISFGNISQKINEKNQFLVTGSGTGKFKKLNSSHYCTVTEFNIDKNNLTCVGPIKASSESMTHGTIYNLDKEIQVVIHIHNERMWEVMLQDPEIPKTKKSAKYGTPEIAYEVERIFKQTDVKQKKIFALEGHKDGVFTFGKNFQEAYSIIYKEYERIIVNDCQNQNSSRSNSRSNSKDRSRSRSRSKSRNKNKKNNSNI